MNDDTINQLIKAFPSFQVREETPQPQLPDFAEITRQANDPQKRPSILVGVNASPRGAGGGGAGGGVFRAIVNQNGYPFYAFVGGVIGGPVA